MADPAVEPARSPWRLVLLAVASLSGLLLWAAACSGSSSVETSSPNTDGEVASATVTQGDGESSSTTTDGAEAEPEADPHANIFSEKVVPILENVCATCHAPGGPGSPHWELATAADAVTFAPAIHLFTQDQSMPPWPASDLSLPFQGDYSLSADEIAAIDIWWNDQGGVIDIDPDTPIVNQEPLRTIEDPDYLITSAKGPYLGSTETVDDYRCMIFDPEVTEAGWIVESHFEADVTETTHHAIITLASGSMRDEAEWWDSTEEGPGWTCYGGSGLQAKEDGDYVWRFGGWAPGGQPNRRPAGYGVPLRPGDFFVVQMHYHYDNDDSRPDLSRMLLKMASDEEIEAEGGRLKTLRGQLFLGPAEIPCVEGDTEPLCDRDLALERVTELYGTFGRNLAQGLTKSCGFTPGDFAHMTDGTASSTCDIRSNHSGQIMSVTGHMHELGQSIRLTLHPDTPDEVILLDIPDWDFEWQFGYRPVEPIFIEKGDIVRVDCTWGRDRAPYEAVGYILWSEGTGDEMCYSSISTAPE